MKGLNAPPQKITINKVLGLKLLSEANGMTLLVDVEGRVYTVDRSLVGIVTLKPLDLRE